MKVAKILIIDDNSKDVLLITGEMDRYYKPLNFKVMPDYVSATKYLFMENHKIPDLILLEITISNNKGLKLLQTIKENSRLKAIPILILTNSQNKRNIEECYTQYISAFIQKPNDSIRFKKLIRVLLQFWIEKVSLPEQVR